MTETNKTKSDMTLIGGIDVGNGYVKGVIKGSLPGSALQAIDEIDIPSAVLSTSRPYPKTPRPDSDALKVMNGDFFNTLDASFSSPLVRDEHRKIFGKAGMQASGSRFIEFNLGGEQLKAEQELSKVLVLGVFAAKALMDWVRDNGGDLPDREISADVFAGLALPIDEYVAKRTSYAAMFTGDVHLVTIKNFNTPVRVRLNFKEVAVMPEGASAQFAINDKGLPLFELLLEDLRARGIELPGVEPRHLYEAKRTIGVDIGEGTVNFAVFSPDPATGRGAFNDNASKTLGVGYGSVLENALENMRGQTDFPFSSRKSLSEVLQEEPNPLTQPRIDAAREYVNAEINDFADQVVDELDEVMSDAGITEVIYVYGGGSDPVKDILYDQLLERIKSAPVCYLDAAYSRHLNREGLYLAANSAAKGFKND